MRRFLCALLSAALVLATGCASGSGASGEGVAVILSENTGGAVNNFNNSALKGVERYCEENDLNCLVYEPDNRNQADFIAFVDSAVKSGAKVIVLPGYLLEMTAFECQDIYPDARFILVDGVPNNGKDGPDRLEAVSANTYSLMYAEEQAGFLAGYAAVTDGFRKLGFFGGMSVPAVIRFGYGYIQGAEYAAGELELDAGEVELRYHYCGSFSPAPEYQALADSWYFQGTEVIFACGGAMGASVIGAAEQAKKWVIGVDTDQSGDSETVLTSALKMVESSVYDAVKSSFEGEFPGGHSLHIGADQGGVGLAMETARFREFDQDSYTRILGMLSAGEIEILGDEVGTGQIPLERVLLSME